MNSKVSWKLPIYGLQNTMILIANTFMSSILTVLSGFLFFCGISIAYFQFMVYEPAYVSKNIPEHWAKQVGPNSISVGRQFEVMVDKEFHITRELIQTKDGILTRVALEDSNVFYKKGFFKVQRLHEIPMIQTGTYQLLNRICWPVNLMRRDCVDLPPLSLFFVSAADNP